MTGSTNDISDNDKEQRIDVLGGGSSTTANSNPVTPNQSKLPSEPVSTAPTSAGVSSILGELAAQDAKMMEIAVKLLDAELLMREDDSDNEGKPKKTPDDVKEFAKNLL